MVMKAGGRYMHRHHGPYNLVAILNEASYDESLFVAEIGHSTPAAGLKKRGVISPDYCIHFVVGGRGLYNNQNICPGKGFLIAANEPYDFEFDPIDPWEHYWIGVDGNMCAPMLRSFGMEPHNHIFDCDWFEPFIPEFRQLLFEDMEGIDYPLYTLGLFYKLMSHYTYMKKPGLMSSPELYFRAAKQFIDENYFERITTEDVARATGITSKYLYKIFMTYLGIAPSAYMIACRLKKSKILLSDTDLTVTEIARSVGYTEPNYFTNSFKRSFGESPSEYRKRKAPHK